MTNAEVAQLMDTDEESIEAAVDELGLVNDEIDVEDLDAIDELLDDGEDDEDGEDEDRHDGDHEDDEDDGNLVASEHG